MASDDDFTGKYVNFNKLDSDVQLLIKESVKARNNAYCPYSNFRVGAALLTDSGIVTGCNIENASLGGTICAERTAIIKAVSSGKSTFEIMAVCADLEEGVISPCGICRQFISEFSQTNNISLYLCDSSVKKMIKSSIWELLPLSVQKI
ncbi:uncharacterized protein LOC106670244 isoform X2 [Cimex lectularius]|uniref:Cytidine deaminase n=1 Tax=Cimex lectularius TaxID=79782 RepID=A0A8I6S2D6_CIMLE|nr:uncharacterized protein LOC106670244 isoform X2 [Cimex lectularius]